MLNLLLRMARVTSRKGEPPRPGTTAADRRPKPKCGSLICVSFVATLFLAVGLLQTFLGIFHAREASRNPILILGPVFIGIGLLLCVAFAEMCLEKFRKPKIGDGSGPPSGDALEENYPEQLKALDLQIANAAFPPVYMLTQDELVPVGPDEMKVLLKEYDSLEGRSEAAQPFQSSSCVMETVKETEDTDAENNNAENKNAENKSAENADLESTEDAKEDPNDILQLLGEVKGVSITE